ncbi:MAG: hypothetical protein K2X77_20385 [Candidatus Obscuribacterales bacterium]|nr:hypothetical protein [Candidatus Obscuribacterales bacterium]
MHLFRKPTGNVIFFIIVCAGILIGIGLGVLQLAMYFGGSGQMAGAVDAGALTVAKYAPQAEHILDDGDEERYMEFADRNSLGVSATEVNDVLAKALLIQMNQAEMERLGLASAESRDHANAMIKAAHDITEKLAAKIAKPESWQTRFEGAANNNSLAFLGTKAKIEMDTKSGWSTSFVDRGEQSNVSFTPQQLPTGFDADTVGIKKGDKYFFKGYTPIKAGDKSLYLVPINPDGQPHLISGKTFDANTLAKSPLKDWPKPFPNAISCQGKSVTDNKQTMQARSFAQINPNGTKPLQMAGWVKIKFDQNVAHWYVNGSPAQSPNTAELASKMIGSLGSMLNETSKHMSNMMSMMGSLMNSVRDAMANAKAEQAGNTAGTPNSAGAAGAEPGANPGTIDSGTTSGIGGGGVANISGPQLNKPAIDKELKEVAQLVKDNGAQISNASHIISDNGGGLISDRGAGIVSDNGGGLISNKGGGVLSDWGAGLISNKGGGIVSDNGGGLISNKGGGIISDNGGGLQQVSNLIGDYGAGFTGGRRSLMSVGENNNSSGHLDLGQRLELATKVLKDQQGKLTEEMKQLTDMMRKPDTGPHGSETNYGFAPEQQNRTFPLGTGTLNVQAFLGNEYKDPANLYQALYGLGGDYKEIKRVIGQRLAEVNGSYNEEDIKKALEDCKLLTGAKTYTIFYDRDEKKWRAAAQREETTPRNADGFEKEVGRDSQQEKPNWVVATPVGIGAKPLPSKCTTRGTFFWKPGTGYNGCLGELRVLRETDIYANGMVSLN